MLKIKIAVFVSGGGTNLQALIDAQSCGSLVSGEISLVISSSEAAFALERAKRHNIPALVVSKKVCGGQEEFESRIHSALMENGIQLIVLAGFMFILSAEFIAKWKKRIINVHPSLIPAFCGKGFYGLRVHKEALKYGVKLTGASVHFVNEIPDGGEIILQKSVSVHKNDTAEKLQRRVMERAEWIILPRAAELVSKKMLKEGEAYDLQSN
jgi:phosphoribosylglycinamide formyltransferase-1